MNLFILLSLCAFAPALPPTLPFKTPQLTTITLSLPPISHASTRQLTTITVTVPPLSNTTPSPPPPPPPPPPTRSPGTRELIGTPSPITIPVDTHSIPTSILLSLPPPIQTPAISIITPSTLSSKIWISEAISILSPVTRTSVPIGSLSSFSTLTNAPIGTLTTILLSLPPPGQTESRPVATPSSIAGEVRASRAIGTLSSGTRISEPIETFSTVTRTSTPIGFLTTSTRASPTCTTGTPVTLEPSGWVVTFTSVTPTAAPEADKSFVAEEWWGREHEIGERSLYTGTDAGYSEFKCQLECSDPKCLGWFVGYDQVNKYWNCIQYDALVSGDELVEARDGDAGLIGGRTFNRICG